MKKIILILGLFLSLTTLAQAQTFTAETNRQDVTTGEVFMLNLTYEGKPTSETPDLSVLKGFTVYSTSQSVRQTINNDVVNYSKQWQIALASENSDGKVTIPSIHLGDLFTSPITITVDNSISNPVERQESEGASPTPQNKKTSRDYSVDTKISNETPYVQQQMNYSIILTDKGNLQIAEPYFSEQDKKNWIIKPVGDPVLTIKQNGNEKIREIAFNYVLFPQKSGELKLPQAQISGYIIGEKQINMPLQTHQDIFSSFFPNDPDFSDVFAVKTPVRLSTKVATIDVKPAPTLPNMTWWLPAKDIKLSAKWETTPAENKIGEAIKRKIFIEGVGITESQIPSLSFGTISGAKQYPEKPVVSSYLHGQNIVTLAEIDNVYIPNKAGMLNIPEIEIYWFNTQTNSLEKAVLPAETIEIQPNPAYQTVQESTQPADPSVDVVSSNTNILPEQNGNAPLVPTTTQASGNSSHKYDYFFLVAAIFFGIFVGLLIGRRPKKNSLSEKTQNNSENYKKNVISAARNKDLKVLREAIIQWAVERYKNDSILNLGDVIKYTKNKDFEKEIEIISASLYAKDINEWIPQNFLEAFEKENKNRVTTYNENQILPNLYK